MPRQGAACVGCPLIFGRLEARQGDGALVDKHTARAWGEPLRRTPCPAGAGGMESPWAGRLPEVMQWVCGKFA